MSSELFREGGPHNIRRVGRDQYQLSVNIPEDSAGLMARECPDDDCTPGYFKVRGGTGLTGESYTVAFCPYCRREAEPNDFYTRQQLEYAKRVAMREAEQGVERMVKQAFGLGPSGKKTLGKGGFLSIEMSYKPSYHPPVGRPLEEELRRDLRCPHCGLEHAVFGIAMWCPDCGQDLFLAHVREEFSAIRKMLGEIDSRRERLGARVAARDIENALEDIVSIFEAVLKLITRSVLRAQGKQDDEITMILDQQVRNAFQSVSRGAEKFHVLVGQDLLGALSGVEREELEATFEMRHPITHNLGVLDRKYLAKVRSGEVEGSEVRVDARHVERALSFAERTLIHAYGFVPAAPDTTASDSQEHPGTSDEEG
ncbi:MAG: hypothetical protein ACKVXR_00630 [Planctomycetota bacterium]